jgi:GNAT superfamily N-acetyltransferase
MPAKSAAADEPVQLTFKPVTRATRDDFIAVFAGPGGPKYCWCMLWRASKDELKQNNSAARKTQILGRIDRRVPIGLVGYRDGEPVAWVSIAPKPTFPGNLGGPQSDAADKVWSLTCMYMRRAIRGQGVGHQLIDAAVRHARKRGARVVEAYPVDPTSPSYRHMGFVPAFTAAGFTNAGRAGTRRHVVRLTLT